MRYFISILLLFSLSVFAPSHSTAMQFSTALFSHFVNKEKIDNIVFTNNGKGIYFLNIQSQNEKEIIAVRLNNPKDIQIVFKKDNIDQGQNDEAIDCCLGDR